MGEHGPDAERLADMPLLDMISRQFSGNYEFVALSILGSMLIIVLFGAWLSR